MVGAHLGPGTGVEEKTRALAEVLQSSAFARSERLKGLLRFLCEAEMEGREADLTEYTIATMALGRPRDFTPLEDSSVRSRVYELRQRLEKFYVQESPNSTLRIELRKGSYIPRYTLVQPEEPPVGQPLVKPVLTAPARRIPVAVYAFVAGAMVMFAALAVWSALTQPGSRVPTTHLEVASAPAWTPELEAFWRPFTANGTPLLIAFETRFFVAMGPLMVRDWRVNSADMIQDSESLMKVKKLFDLRFYGNREYSDGGTPQALFYLTRLLSPRIANLTVKNSLDVTAADLRDNNVVFLGKPGMEQGIEQVLSHGDLVDVSGKILNLHPGAGEQTEYKDESDSKDPTRWGRKYSVVTMMPGSTAGKRILALTASGAEQPASLAYYVTNTDTMKDLYRKMHLDSGKRPEFFQVLTRAEYKSRSVVKVEYVTDRALKMHP